jgi:hypothetical protein
MREQTRDTDMDERPRIRRAQSCAIDARQAAREFHAAVTQPDMALVVFFCSSEYDLDALAEEIGRLFAGVQVVGCTTAGEIGPAGYREHSIAGASLSAGDFTAACGRIDDLRRFEIVHGQRFVQDLLRELGRRAPQADADNSFAFLMIDGLSVREEQVTRTFQHALGKLPLVGGSAGDGLRFRRTCVYHDGRFRSGSAVLILITTPVPFRLFMTEHFVASEQRVVVTGADAKRRVVSEIDGRPAAEAYAELIGTSSGNLDPMRFAASPMVVVIGGNNYVRSIGKARADGSLKFFCAVEEGMVLRVAHGANLVDNLDQAFAGIRAAIGEPRLIIGCDCILRRVEIVQSRLIDRVQEILQRNRVVGFNTYGEQYRGVHVNQTFTGVAIGGAAAGRDGG